MALTQPVQVHACLSEAEGNSCNGVDIGRYANEFHVTESVCGMTFVHWTQRMTLFHVLVVNDRAVTPRGSGRTPPTRIQAVEKAFWVMYGCLRHAQFC